MMLFEVGADSGDAFESYWATTVAIRAPGNPELKALTALFAFLAQRAGGALPGSPGGASLASPLGKSTGDFGATGGVAQATAAGRAALSLLPPGRRVAHDGRASAAAGSTGPAPGDICWSHSRR